MEQKRKLGLYAQVAIFFLAIPASLSQMAAPVANQIAEEFGMSVTQMGLITSLPSLSMIFTQLFGSYLVTKVERKVLLTIGLVLAVVGGVGPNFVSSAYAVLGMRILLGLGIGLVNPLSATYIAEYPTGMRPKLTSRWQFVGSAGGAAIMALTAPVSSLGWKAVLMLYLVMAIFIFTSLTALPTTGALKKSGGRPGNSGPGEKLSLPFEYFAGMVVALLLMVIYIGATSYMSMYVNAAGLGGNTILSSSALTIARLVGAFGALLVPVLLKAFKRYLAAFSAAMCLIAVLLYTIPNAVTILIGYAFIYWSSVVACVACTTRNTLLLPLRYVATGQAILTSLTYFCQFVSTYAVELISSLMKVEVTAPIVLYVLMIPVIAAAAISYVSKDAIKNK